MLSNIFNAKKTGFSHDSFKTKHFVSTKRFLPILVQQYLDLEYSTSNFNGKAQLNASDTVLTA